MKNTIGNIKELTMLYLKNVVILLTDIFQKITDTCEKAYGINPLYSYNTNSSIYMESWFENDWSKIRLYN